MASNNTSSGGGLSFTGALTILFIALKLTHVINWSWWWVLSPMWISFLILLAVLAIILIVYLISEFSK
jgi:hypothetical protein